MLVHFSKMDLYSHTDHIRHHNHSTVEKLSGIKADPLLGCSYYYSVTLTLAILANNEIRYEWRVVVCIQEDFSLILHCGVTYFCLYISQGSCLLVPRTYCARSRTPEGSAGKLGYMPAQIAKQIARGYLMLKSLV